MRTDTPLVFDNEDQHRAAFEEVCDDLENAFSTGHEDYDYDGNPHGERWRAMRRAIAEAVKDAWSEGVSYDEWYSRARSRLVQG